jgi:hypothetical protein
MTEDERLGRVRRKCSLCGEDLSYSESDPCERCEPASGIEERKMDENKSKVIEQENEEHAKWQESVRSKGYLSQLSGRLEFISFSDEKHTWLEIKFDAGTVRMDITENRIKVVGPFLKAERTAMNAAEITFRSEYKEKSAH